MTASFLPRIHTRDKRWLVFFCVTLLSLSLSGQTTLYTYQSGSWNNIDVWTTDPGGTTLVGSKIPGDGDAVVVLPSRTLSLAGNISNTGLSLTVHAGGTFDAVTFAFENPLALLSGQGTYRLSSASFPAAGTNTLAGNGGGTVEYYNGADFTLPLTQATYFNLTINCAGFIATQLNDLTINGNLVVRAGTFRINDANPARRTLLVNGDVAVSNGAFLTVGTGSTVTTSDPTATGTGGTAPFLNYYIVQSHRVEIYGNLTNDGTVRFTNQDFPVFNTFPSNGIGSVFFRGAADRTITCNGTTDFYNLIVDKGTDQTFVLAVNSAGYDKFRIFGANNAGEFGDPANPDIRKALWIRNGSLRLNGFAFIPSLTEGGGDFIIPGNGALILGSPDVVVMGTIDNYSVVELAYGVNGLGGTNGVSTGSLVPSGIALYGKLQISEGKMYVGEYGRIVYYGSSASAQFIINGGVIDIKQFQSVLGGGKTAYWQTGGNLILRGRFQRSLLYTSISNLVSSIGNPAQLNTARLAGPDPGSATLNIDQPENIFRMEGGSIDILDVTSAAATAEALEINSDPANVTVTGGTVNVSIIHGTALADADYNINSTAPLFNTVITRTSGDRRAVLNRSFEGLNDLTLVNTSGTAAAVLDASGFRIKVGGDFLIQSNAVYTPGNNRTILNGSGPQNFTNFGTITSGLHRFIIDKNASVATLGSDVTVRDSLVILSGTLNDGGFTLSVAGNIYNAGSHTGTGKILLNGVGTGTQVLSASVSGTAVMGNIEINSSTTNAVAATLASDFSASRLSITSNHIFDISSYLLSIGAGGITCTSPGASKMVRTNGLSSNKGLELLISLSGTYTNSVVATYPVGVAGKFTPASVIINGSPGTVSGKFRIVPVNNCHPSSDCNASKTLQYYWKTFASSGLQSAVSSTVKFQFTYTEAPTGPKALFINTDGTWNQDIGGITGNNLIFPSPLTGAGIGFQTNDFTSGNPSNFNKVETYYTVKSGNFNDASVWSTISHTSPGGTAGLPKSTSRVIIGGQTGALVAPRTTPNDSITVPNAYNINVASIQINGTYTGNSRTPVLNIQGSTGHTIDIITGAGKFSTSTPNIPSSDYGEFLNNNTAVFNYFGGTYTLSTLISEYPNLLIQGNGTKSLRNDITKVRKDLIIADPVNAGNILSLNAASGNIVVYGNVNFRNGSKLVIPASSNSRTVEIYGNIDFRYGNTSNINSIEASAGAGAVHNISFFGNIINSGSSNLSLNQAGTNKADLYLKDAGNLTVTHGSGNFSLNRLLIQKSQVADTVFFRHDFTLNESGNSSSSKSLTLSSGTLILSDPSNGSASTMNLNLSSGGINSFILNSASRLILRNGSKVNITGNTLGSGIKLDGMLRAEGASEINLADGTPGNTGYIEYSGSGNASISINGSAILKAAQVRRSLSLTTGLLNYNQGGSSAVTIYGLGTAGIIDPSRAKLEVTGTGSSFNMSGTSTISIINGGGTTFGDLFLRPGSSSVTGGTIIFGSGASGQVYKVDATAALNNLTLSASSTTNDVQLMVNPLVLMGNLNLEHAGSRFVASNIDLTIGGNFTCNGIYTAGTNTTLFNGSTQVLSGTNDPLFNNLTVSPSVKLTINRNITVGSTLNITSGTLDAGTYTVTARGNVTNNGIIASDPAGTGRLLFNGTSIQSIAGSGSFGKIELDNASGGARLGNDLALSEDLTLTNGVLDINQYSLVLGAGSDITPLVFGTGRMIKSDGVFSNGGITKYFNAGFSGNFVYPSGVSGKYTPATLTINATNSGWIRLNVINQKHPATLTPFNVLGYYWEAESGISGFDGSVTFKYEASDVTGNEYQYVAGRLIIPPGTGWSKAAAGPLTDNVNEAAHTIFFNFPAGTTNLGGQYTAGYTSDLPSTIPVYTSNTPSGDWNNINSWLPVPPAGGPDGVIVIIRAGDVINTAGNKRFAFRTSINGTLNVGTSYGHNLGTVDGTGKLSLSQANLPAGDFSAFLGCEGGTLEYDGGSYTIVADRIDTVKNLIFKGTGTKTLPDKDLVICNQLLIDGPALDNHFNRKLSIGGSFILSSGNFLSGTGAGATVSLNGTSPQTLSGFRSANPLNNLEISNSSGLTLNSAIMMKGNLLLTNGIITTTSDSLLKMTSQSATASSGSASSFVNGPMSKNQLGGIDFTFPVGKGSRFGELGLISPNSGVWEAEYFNTAYPDATVAGTLVRASTSEYWRINSPAAGKTTTVQLRWDSQSDISPLTTSGGISDIRVAEYDGTDWREKASASPSGNDTYGTVNTSANIPVSNAGHPRFFTLGSATMVKPAITLGISEPVCRCVTAGSLPYLSVTGGADQYTIDFSAAANTEGFTDVAAWTTLPAGAVSITVPAAADPGVYTGTIRVRALSSPANISIPYAFSVIILPDIKWTGLGGTEWNSTGNWSCAFLPDGTMPVIIPDVANEPVISPGWTGSVNNLTISAGSSLSVSGILRISGTITNNGTFNATAGHIELNGTSAQIVPAGLFSGNAIKDLTVNNAAGVVLQGPLGVSGIVKVQSGNLASAGNLTLLSTGLGTALVDGSGTGNITGNVTMQRYLSSRFGYKYFSSPFQDATVNQFAEEVNLAYWFPLFYAFDENRNYMGTPIEPFYGYATPSNPLVPMTGYAINFGADPSALTINVTGALNNSSYSKTVTNHNHPYSLGRNLLGNPYPSPIDWNAPLGWTKVNVDNALYYFNASAADEWGGTYSSWVNGVSSDGIASNIIPSMQGFMVRASTVSPVDGTVGMDNRVRVNNMSQPFIKKSVMVAEKPLLRISASFTDSYPEDDPLVIYFDDKATEDFDPDLDAVKYFNTDWFMPSFFSFGKDGSKLSINALPLPDAHIPSIPLGYRSDVDGEVIFRLRNIEGPYSWGVINLFDVETGESHDISSGSEYRVYIPSGDYFDRFWLNFEGFATGASEKEILSDPFLVYSSRGLVYAEINCLQGKSGTLTISNITGQAVYNTKIHENGHHEFDPAVRDGIYIVSFVSGNLRFSEKIFIKGK